MSKCTCAPCSAARASVAPERHPGKELREAVATAIRNSVIRGNVLGGTHTTWTDWAPEADAAITVMRDYPPAETDAQWIAPATPHVDGGIAHDVEVHPRIPPVSTAPTDRPGGTR